MKRRILLSASLFHALTDAAGVITPMIFPILYNQQFLITRYSQIGLLSNLGLLLTFVFQFLVVGFSFRVEYRRLMFASGLGICASMALVPFARSFAMLVLFFVLIRLATSFYHPLIIAWVSRSRSGSGQELDDAMGIQSGSGNAGVILAYLTVGLLAQHWGWKIPLYAWSVFGLAIVLLGTLALKGVSSRGDRPAGREPSSKSWFRSLAVIKKHIPGFFVGGMGWSVVVYYAPSLLNHKFNIPMGQTGLFLALWIGLGTFSGYGYGVWSRRFGRKKVYAFSLGGAMACLLLIGLAPSKSLAVLGLILYGGFLLMTYPSLHTAVGSTVTEADQTHAFSWVSNIQLLSGAIITLISGFLSDALGISFPFILAGILTLGVFLYYLPRREEFFGGAMEPAEIVTDVIE